MPVGIGHADAVDMQTTGSKIVLDSLENWQVHGNLPFSKFDYNNTGNQYVFANQSLRSTSYNWDFGDGSAFSTLTNPTHTYTAAGTYVVTLTAKNACGKSSVSFDTIVVSSVPNNIIEANNPELPILDLQGHFIRVKNAAINDQLIITNTHGQIIWKGIMSATDNNYVLPPNSTGLCFYQIVRKGKPLTQGKLLIR
jgi:PKD repeat protein